VVRYFRAIADGDPPPVREDEQSLHLTSGMLRVLNRQVWRAYTRNARTAVATRCWNDNNTVKPSCYLFQRISVPIQRFNATLLHESFADENRSDD